MIGATDEFSSRRDEEGNDNFLGKKKKKKVKKKKRVEQDIPDGDADDFYLDRRDETPMTKAIREDEGVPAFAKESAYDAKAMTHALAMKD